MNTVFIVDDNDANLFAAQTALIKRYNVYTLPSAVAMFKLIEKVVPDLIIMDIQMPEMNGFEAVGKLKADQRYSHIPVIFLTGQTDMEMEERCIGLGAADFIQKPFSEPVLLRRVKTLLEIEELIAERTGQLLLQIEALQLEVEKLKNELNGLSA